MAILRNSTASAVRSICLGGVAASGEGMSRGPPRMMSLRATSARYWLRLRLRAAARASISASCAFVSEMQIEVWPLERRFTSCWRVDCTGRRGQPGNCIYSVIFHQ